MRGPRHRRGGERGFVLVGVVMLVLALTILGLSMFGLSGYEAQFLGTSQREMQAYYDAIGAIERAKLAMASVNTLECAAANLPPHVVYTRARYVDTGDSVGPVPWDGSRQIEIRAIAEISGARRAVEARFTPTKSTTVYENLISSYTSLQTGEYPDRIELYGSPSATIQHNSGDLSWQGEITSPPPPLYLPGEVPAPEVATYLGTFGPGALPPTSTPASGLGFRLEAPTTETAFFVGPNAPHDDFGFHTHLTVDLWVDGTVVWMLPGGGYIGNELRVHGSSGDRLVIVGKRSAGTDYFSDVLGMPSAGLWLRGGVSSDVVPVILVSDGTIAIEQLQNHNNDTNTEYMSIFGLGAFFRGPGVAGNPGSNPDKRMRIRHPSSQDGPVLDLLIERGHLPNTTPGRNKKFVFISGTWREVTEDDPS